MNEEGQCSPENTLRATTWTQSEEPSPHHWSTTHPHTPDSTLVLNKSLLEVKPNPALFHSTVAAPLSSCSDYPHPCNNTAAPENPREGRRCLSIQSLLLLWRGREERSRRIGQTRNALRGSRGGREGSKLLLPAGNKYLNNSVLTSNMC